jgi:hypothetical protein
VSAQLRQYGRSTLGVWPPPIVTAIREGQAFRSGALRGESGSQWDRSPGRLEGKALAQWRDDLSSIAYVVWSYSTPIGWQLRDGAWVVPDDRYSLTTTRHQSFVHLASNGATS